MLAGDHVTKKARAALRGPVAGEGAAEAEVAAGTHGARAPWRRARRRELKAVRCRKGTGPGARRARSVRCIAKDLQDLRDLRLQL